MLKRVDHELYEKYSANNNLEDWQRYFLRWYESGGKLGSKDRYYSRRMRKLINQLRDMGYSWQQLYERVKNECSMYSLQNASRQDTLNEATCRNIDYKLRKLLN